MTRFWDRPYRTVDQAVSEALLADITDPHVTRLPALIGSVEQWASTGMSQSDLGRALAPLLGRPWSRQAVSAAEKGARDFKIAELVAIARVLGTTVSKLVLPGPEVREAVVFPSGETISVMELIDAVLSPVVDLDSERGQVLRTGNELADYIVEARVRSIEANEAGAKSFEALSRLLQQVQSIARQPETTNSDKGEES